ncbi:MAG: RnfABCDGE type electron transport complex subunit B [Gammaproteobacteria bacterium]|nr:RnfABCDGE type electron transport complex subunit B [Gammaproteobacteria bacterium]
MLAERIDALLPQTQCRRCGFDGCRPYAEALARGESALNRCPPGGRDVIARLAALLGRPVLPLDPDCGHEGPQLVALIDEEACIGCARCLNDCPTDAIVGARKRMHTVIALDCSGCELCLPLCPVDCIDMVEAPAAPERDTHPAHYRRLYDSRRTRLARGQAEWRDALRASLAQDGAPAD